MAGKLRAKREKGALWDVGKQEDDRPTFHWSPGVSMSNCNVALLLRDAIYAYRRGERTNERTDQIHEALAKVWRSLKRKGKVLRFKLEFEFASSS